LPRWSAGRPIPLGKKISRLAAPALGGVGSPPRPLKFAMLYETFTPYSFRVRFRLDPEGMA
jgi:hypothetical protein